MVSNDRFLSLLMLIIGLIFIRKEILWLGPSKLPEFPMHKKCLDLNPSLKGSPDTPDLNSDHDLGRLLRRARNP